jgi:radical SAM superfamily enzyme YgiQ (UPF0313 family)
MKKIIFIEPRSPDFHVFNRFNLPRLGIVILGTILKNMGYNVRIYIESIHDLDFEDIFTSDLVGISTITSTAPRAYEIARTIKKHGIPVFMGGPHPTYMTEEALQYCDYVIRGEADLSINDFINAFEKNEGFENVPGLSFWKNREIFHNQNFNTCLNLDILPFPDFSIIHGLKKQKIAPVVTSRGCPFDCNFCSVTTMFGRKYRFRSTENIIAELKTIKSDYVFFYDDNFTADKFRTKQLLKNIIDNDIKIRWTAQVRVDVARDKELLDLMKQSGCHTCYIGLESINPETLKVYNKKQTLEDIEECIIKLNENGIRIHGMFVLGADEDSIDTIKQTARFAKKHKISTIQFMILTPLPGTRYFNDMLAQNRLIIKDWSLFDGFHVVFKPKSMTLFELQFETLRAMASFYSIWQIIKRAIKFDFYNSFIKSYAHRLLHKWRRKNRYFLTHLKEFTDTTKKEFELKARKTADDIIEKVRQFHKASLKKAHIK